MEKFSLLSEIKMMTKLIELMTHRKLISASCKIEQNVIGIRKCSMIEGKNVSLILHLFVFII